MVGGEFIGKAVSALLLARGIVRTLTAPYNPAQNPFVERMNRKVVEASDSMLSQAGMPGTFWAEAVCYAVYVLNRMPHRGIGMRSPLELWGSAVGGSLGEKGSTLKYARTFGCEVYYRNPMRTAGAPRGLRGAFLGVDSVHKSYRVWSFAKRKVVFSRDVRFNETVFPFSESVPPVGSQPDRGYGDCIWESDVGGGIGAPLESEGSAASPVRGSAPQVGNRGISPGTSPHGSGGLGFHTVGVGSPSSGSGGRQLFPHGVQPSPPPLLDGSGRAIRYIVGE